MIRIILCYGTPNFLLVLDYAIRIVIQIHEGIKVKCEVKQFFRLDKSVCCLHACEEGWFMANSKYLDHFLQVMLKMDGECDSTPYNFCMVRCGKSWKWNSLLF